MLGETRVELTTLVKMRALKIIIRREEVSQDSQNTSRYMDEIEAVLNFFCMDPKLTLEGRKRRIPIKSSRPHRTMRFVSFSHHADGYQC